MRAIVCPGQGSQAVGMGQELAADDAAARQVFQEVDDALGAPLSKTMWEGPEEALRLTENAQPALMAHSVATMRALEARGFDLAAQVSFAAGHSLGEYSALCVAGALSVADAARLLRLRGAAMQSAVPVGEGAMTALLGLDLATAEAVAMEAADGLVCEAANDNAPGQVVLSGHKAAIDRAMTIAKEKGAKRALPLNVSAPFHCALMQPAADAMAEALAGVEIHAPTRPIVANVTAAPVENPEEIRRLLVAQVTARVRWRESAAWMAAQGVTELIEIGTGKVLTGLAKRIDARLVGRAVGGSAEIDALIGALG